MSLHRNLGLENDMERVTIQKSEYDGLLQIHKEYLDMLMDADLVQITKEKYQQLLDSHNLLNALYNFGVGDWEGYFEAVDSVRLK